MKTCIALSGSCITSGFYEFDSCNIYLDMHLTRYSRLTLAFFRAKNLWRNCGKLESQSNGARGASSNLK